MKEAVLCEKCGTLMEYYQRCGSCGMLCPKCGWGWATTYVSPLKADRTVYTVLIFKSERPSLNEIKCVSKLKHCNFIQAKALLNESDNFISGKAVDIIESIRLLSKFGVRFSVDPKFPHDIAEGIEGTENL